MLMMGAVAYQLRDELARLAKGWTVYPAMAKLPDTQYQRPSYHRSFLAVPTRDPHESHFDYLARTGGDGDLPHLVMKRPHTPIRFIEIEFKRDLSYSLAYYHAEGWRAGGPLAGMNTVGDAQPVEGQGTIYAVRQIKPVVRRKRRWAPRPDLLDPYHPEIAAKLIYETVVASLLIRRARMSRNDAYFCLRPYGTHYVDYYR